jgi:muconate cycloisomerase
VRRSRSRTRSGGWSTRRRRRKPLPPPPSILTIKIKVGRSEEYDVRIVREVRETVGETSTSSSTRTRMADPEARDPSAPPDGSTGSATPSSRSRDRADGADRAGVDVPIMADERLTPRDVLEIVERGAADMISLYTTKPGGLFKAKKVAAVAEAAGLRST